MTRVSDKVFDIAIKLYACADADMHDANAIRLAVAELERENERLRTRVGWLDHLDTPEGRAMHATEAVRVENEELNAEIERLRSHIHSAETASFVELGALRMSLKQVDADVDALRADLREALELLRWASPDMDHASWDEWGGRANLLLAKHKENQ